MKIHHRLRKFLLPVLIHIYYQKNVLSINSVRFYTLNILFKCFPILYNVLHVKSLHCKDVELCTTEGYTLKKQHLVGRCSVLFLHFFLFRIWVVNTARLRTSLQCLTDDRNKHWTSKHYSFAESLNPYFCRTEHRNIFISIQWISLCANLHPSAVSPPASSTYSSFCEWILHWHGSRWWCVCVGVGGGPWSLQTMKMTHLHVSKSSRGTLIGGVQHTHSHAHICMHTYARMHPQWAIPQAL